MAARTGMSKELTPVSKVLLGLGWRTTAFEHRATHVTGTLTFWTALRGQRLKHVMEIKTMPPPIEDYLSPQEKLQ